MRGSDGLEKPKYKNISTLCAIHVYICVYGCVPTYYFLINLCFFAMSLTPLKYTFYKTKFLTSKLLVFIFLTKCMIL